MHDYPPSDWPEMSVRVEEAQRRIRAGLGLLSIPAHWGDADLVLGDLARENAALRKRVAELELAVDVAESRKSQVLHDLVDRAAKAERERDSLAEGFESRGRRLESLQADLDAALDWIENECPPPQGDFPADQPILALLEKRRERG